MKEFRHVQIYTDTGLQAPLLSPPCLPSNWALPHPVHPFQSEAATASDENPQDQDLVSHVKDTDTPHLGGEPWAWPSMGETGSRSRTMGACHTSVEFSQGSLETWRAEWEMLLREGSSQAVAQGFPTQWIYFLLGKQSLVSKTSLSKARAFLLCLCSCVMINTCSCTLLN